MPCSFRWHFFGLCLECLQCMLLQKSSYTILDSVFNAMFLQVTLFWILSWVSSMHASSEIKLHYSGLCLQCHVPAGDTFLGSVLSVFNACVFRNQVTLFWTLSSMPCSCRWQYSGLCLQCHSPLGDNILDSVFNAGFFRWQYSGLRTMFLHGYTVLDFGPCSFMVTLFGTLHHVTLVDSILDSVFNACFFSWHYSGLCLLCHIPLGDTILNSVYNAMFLKGTWQWGGFSGVFAEIGFS